MTSTTVKSPVEVTLEAKSLTRQALADDLGVTRQVLNRWLKGRAPWPAQRKPQVAKFLGVPEAELFGEA